jgi:hypothetical protein
VTRPDLVLADLAAAAGGCKDRTAQVVKQLERPAEGCVLERVETLELDWEKPDGCRALALHLESGELGPVDSKRIVELLARACETGDEDACGNHATAADTFTPPARDAGAQ